MPAGLAMLWTFHAVLKRPLLALAPRAVQEALAPFANRFPFGRAPTCTRCLILWPERLSRSFSTDSQHERGLCRFTAERGACALPSRWDRVSACHVCVLAGRVSICMALLLLLQCCGGRESSGWMSSPSHGHPLWFQPSVCSLRWRFRLPCWALPTQTCASVHSRSSRSAASLAAARSAPPPVPCSSSSFLGFAWISGIRTRKA